MPRKVLSPEQIAEIPARLAAGATPKSLSADWGVHRSTINYHALGGKAVKYVRDCDPTRPRRRHNAAITCIAQARIAIRQYRDADAANHLLRAAEILQPPINPS